MCVLRGGHYRIVAVNLSCATGPKHHVFRSFYATRDNILVCAYPVAVVRCELVHGVAIIIRYPRCYAVYCQPRPTSTVESFFTSDVAALRCPTTGDILLFIYILLIVLFTALNLDIRSSF